MNSTRVRVKVYKLIPASPIFARGELKIGWKHNIGVRVYDYSVQYGIMFSLTGSAPRTRFYLFLLNEISSPFKGKGAE